MTCPSCQARITSETIFCPNCGTEIGAFAFGRPESSLPGMPVPTSLDTPTGFAASLPSPGAPPSALSNAASYPLSDGPSEGLVSDVQLYVVPVSSFVRLFGPRAEPEARSLTPAWTLLRRVLPRRYATNPWVGAVLGALVALGLGLALMLPVAAAWVRLQPLLPFDNSITGLGTEGISELWTLFRVDPVKLLLFAERVPIHVAIHLPPSAGGEIQPSLYATQPLLGLLLLPALGLVVGGYLSASTLAVRVPRYALARGALIGPVYGATLFALATVAAGRPSRVSLGVEYLISPQPAWALFYGTLWGLLFGALGGWIAVSGRVWLSAALATLRAGAHPRVAGALAGAGVALSCGLLLYFALEVGALGITMLHLGPAFQMLNPSSSGAPAVQPTAPRLFANIVALSAVLGLPGAIWLFTLGAGASWNAFQRAAGDFASSSHGTFGLVGTPAGHQPPIWLLLMLIPLVSYLAGGRVAARVAGARSRQEAILAGAALALPLSAVLALLAQVATVGIDEVGGNAVSSSGLTPSIGGTFLAVLIGGALLGGLGGLSWLALPDLARLTRLPLAPLRLIERPGFALLDRLIGRDRAQSLSPVRRWFYDGLLAVLLFGLLVAVADLITAHVTTPEMLAHMELADSLLAALLLVAPLLCFGVALLVALLTRADAAPPAFDPPIQPRYYALLPAHELGGTLVPSPVPELP